MCAYCNEGVALVIGKTNDYGIAIQYPNNLIAYGYDVHGSGSNGLDIKINFCPMCGRKLVDKCNGCMGASNNDCGECTRVYK